MCELIWRKSKNGVRWWLSPRNWDGGGSAAKFWRGGGAPVTGMGKMAPGKEMEDGASSRQRNFECRRRGALRADDDFYGDGTEHLRLGCAGKK
jgi:hypothetical protein